MCCFCAVLICYFVGVCSVVVLCFCVVFQLRLGYCSCVFMNVCCVMLVLSMCFGLGLCFCLLLLNDYMCVGFMSCLCLNVLFY